MTISVDTNMYSICKQIYAVSTTRLKSANINFPGNLTESIIAKVLRIIQSQLDKSNPDSSDISDLKSYFSITGDTTTYTYNDIDTYCNTTNVSSSQTIPAFGKNLLYLIAYLGSYNYIIFNSTATNTVKSDIDMNSPLPTSILADIKSYAASVGVTVDSIIRDFVVLGLASTKSDQTASLATINNVLGKYNLSPLTSSIFDQTGTVYSISLTYSGSNTINNNFNFIKLYSDQSSSAKLISDLIMFAFYYYAYKGYKWGIHN
jgi:hypothetical protein